jgi:hypothetical protein
LLKVELVVSSALLVASCLVSETASRDAIEPRISVVLLALAMNSLRMAVRCCRLAVHLGGHRRAGLLQFDLQFAELLVVITEPVLRDAIEDRGGDDEGETKVIGTLPSVASQFGEACCGRRVISAST